MKRYIARLPTRLEYRKCMRESDFELSKEYSSIGMAQNNESELALLKSHLAITPKTARMLHDAGYSTPQSLANASPNEIMQKFAALPGMDLKKAKDYLRPGRRMAMTGAVEDPEEAANVDKNCKNWTKKELERLGVWDDNFDDLTGTQIRDRVGVDFSTSGYDYSK